MEDSPGKLSQSVGGHIVFGETPELTLERKFSEELGIACAEVSPVTTYFHDSRKDKNQELVYLYRGYHSGPINPNYSRLEWAAFFWIKEH